MIAASLAPIILAGVLSIAILIMRSSARIVNYSTMETQTRSAFEQLAVDARGASAFAANFTNGKITSFTLTIPTEDGTATTQVTYGYDTTDASNRKFYRVSGNDPAATAGRSDLISNLTNLTVLRYDSGGGPIPAATTSSAGIKHLQISIDVRRSSAGVATATQLIRSSAFTLRNI
jgi:hypothetical protein